MELFNDSAIDNIVSGRTEGTGLRYVRSRLEEAYPGQWSLSAVPVGNGWKAEIDLLKVNL
jgi:hypothetical protein